MVKETATVCGDPATPGAATVTVPVCRPGASPAVAGVTETVRGAEPEPGVTVSQGTLADAVKESDPPPALVTLIALVSTVGAPWTALKDSEPGAPRAAAVGAVDRRSASPGSSAASRWRPRRSR